jgi:hypothetical protein
MFVRIIDDDGYFIEDAFVDELTDNTITTPCPEGFYLPRWNGTKWVEGGEAPEPSIQAPTLEERTEALENALLALMGGGE